MKHPIHVQHRRPNNKTQLYRFVIVQREKNGRLDRAVDVPDGAMAQLAHFRIVFLVIDVLVGFFQSLD